MKIRLYTFNIALFFLTTLAIFSACDRFKGPEGLTGPKGPSGPGSVFIKGYVLNNEKYKTYTAYVNVINSKSLPSVTVNEVELTYDFNVMYIGHYFNKAFLTPFQTTQLNASFTTMDGKEGTATAQLTAPGSFEITEHSHDIDPLYGPLAPFSPDEIFSISWSPSDNAELYVVLINWFATYEIQYKTTLVGPHRYNFIITDTSLEIPLTDLCPESIFEKIDEMDDFYGMLNFEVYAFAGPHNPGEPGNITGDAEGMFYTITACPSFLFTVRLPGTAKQVPSTSLQEEAVPNNQMNELIDKWLMQPESSVVEFIEKGLVE